MGIFDVEIVKFWRSLQSSDGKFILAGDFASHLHGHKGFTGMMEIWIKNTQEDRENLYMALKKYGVKDINRLQEKKFVIGELDFTLRNGLFLDIVTDMKGLEDLGFDECRNMASIAEIDDVQVPFLHINHLIQNKKKVGREKDQLDVIYLEKIKKLRGQ